MWHLHTSIHLTFVFCAGAHNAGPGHRGLEANKLIASLIAAHPSLRPLVLVLKCFLTRRSLCESFTGGLSSYALLLMAARFLQEACGKAGVSDRTRRSSATKAQHAEGRVTDLGSLLVGFLSFFGDRFEPRETGISVRRQCYFARSFRTAALNAAMGAGLDHVPIGIALDRRHSFQVQDKAR